METTGLTGRATERVHGHECAIQKARTHHTNALDPPDTFDTLDRTRGGRFSSHCECGWHASADKVATIKRLRHLHLARVVDQGADIAH